MRRDLGDFQTPPGLVDAVIRAVGPIGTRWPRVLEPTCGEGRFLHALLACEDAPREFIGVEVQEIHAERARAVASEASNGRTRVSIVRANLFDVDLRKDLSWSVSGGLLVLGNPPWITNAELGRLGSKNLPTKSNFKKMAGLEARTGASNFDIAESIWFKLISELISERPTIVLLCKMSVARNILEHVHRNGVPVSGAKIHTIDAARWFRTSVSACLLTLTLGPGPGISLIPVFDDLTAVEPTREFGFNSGRLITDPGLFQRCKSALGTSSLDWRQGLKHDAASVMELVQVPSEGLPRNGLSQTVDVESDYIFPLLKGSDLRRPFAARRIRSVIVTQARIGDDTLRLVKDAPRLWSYLQSHADRFAGRKSRIYRGHPPFACFGVGPYSFSEYKVAVSGLHRDPCFRALGPIGGRPVILDDTCYLTPCPNGVAAALIAALANDPLTRSLLRSMILGDAKRPVTKGLLRQIDLAVVLEQADRADLIHRTSRILVDDLEWPEPDVAEIEDEIGRMGAYLGRPSSPASDPESEIRPEPDIPALLA